MVGPASRLAGISQSTCEPVHILGDHFRGHEFILAEPVARRFKASDHLWVRNPHDPQVVHIGMDRRLLRPGGLGPGNEGQG
jgi:hypothetical protein